MESQIHILDILRDPRVSLDELGVAVDSSAIVVEGVDVDGLPVFDRSEIDRFLVSKMRRVDPLGGVPLVQSVRSGLEARAARLEGEGKKALELSKMDKPSLVEEVVPAGEITPRAKPEVIVEGSANDISIEE